VIVGESLGQEEESEGKPFVGTDGKILMEILASTGLSRESLYITNVVKVRPPGNKVERLGDLGLGVEDFIPFLKEELEGIDCRVCVPLGDLALNVLTGKDGITKHRGSIYPSTLIPGYTCLPTLHPGFVREVWSARGVVIADIKKALRVANSGHTTETFSTITRPTLGQVHDYTRILGALDRFTFDIEVVGGKQIACVGLGGWINGKRSSLCIPFKHGYRNYYSREEESIIWSLLEQLFQSDALKIGQNINYDLTFLFPFIGEASPPWYDLMVAHYVLDPELPHSLAFLTSIYTDIPYYKDDPKDEGETWATYTPSERLWDYNGKDCEGPLIIESKLTTELRKEGLYNFFTGYEMNRVRATFRLSQRGMHCDEEMKQRILQERTEELALLNIDLATKIGYAINVESPKQIMKFLYEDLKIPTQYHRKTHRPTANKETLEKLFARYPDERFKMFMEARGISKEIGAYLKARPSPDGKYRGLYKPCGTKTGRSSCEQMFGGVGLDFQNVPPAKNGRTDIRAMFIPGTGKEFTMYDLWQAEAWPVAIMSQSRRFLEKLNKHEKIHTMVAGWIYAKEEKAITQEEYDVGKRTVHARNYGLGPNLFATIIKKPVAEAKRILATYDRYAPEIESVWHAEVRRVLQESRKLVTPFGRVRYFRERWGEDMFREAYAHTPQSTVAELAHQAQCRLEFELPSHAKIVQEGFDSLVIEHDKGKGEEVDELVTRAFDKEIFWKGTSFKIPVEGKRGERWEK